MDWMLKESDIGSVRLRVFDNAIANDKKALKSLKECIQQKMETIKMIEERIYHLKKDKVKIILGRSKVLKVLEKHLAEFVKSPHVETTFTVVVQKCVDFNKVKEVLEDIASVNSVKVLININKGLGSLDLPLPVVSSDSETIEITLYFEKDPRPH